MEKLLDLFIGNPLGLACVGAHYLYFALPAWIVLAVRLSLRRLSRLEGLCFAIFSLFVVLEIVQLSVDRSFLRRELWGLARYFGVFAPFLWLWTAKAAADIWCAPVRRRAVRLALRATVAAALLAVAVFGNVVEIARAVTHGFGSEALARWNHPVRGMLLPRSFIPPLERNGLIAELDFFIFEQVCRNLRSWKMRNLPLHPVSCNFSRLHFGHTDFPMRLAKIARRHNVPSSLLEVEITEEAISQNPEAAWMQLIRLRELGFKTVIDDFGTGYSALSLLQMLCADAIKIDREFIRRDLPGQRAQTVLGHIIRMAKDLEMNVICEGVENAEQASIIMKLGCSVAQGYFYAKAEPAYAFETRLAMQGM